MEYAIEEHDLSVIIQFIIAELNELSKSNPDGKKIDKSRQYVRTFFSLVEGVSFRTRQRLLVLHEVKSIVLTEREQHILSEKSVDIGNNGEIVIKDKFYGFEKLFKFTFKTYAKHFRKEEEYGREIISSGYKKLIKVQKIRNRITHLKNAESIIVSEDELKDAMEAFKWFQKFIIIFLVGDLLTSS